MHFILRVMCAAGLLVFLGYIMMYNKKLVKKLLFSRGVIGDKFYKLAGRRLKRVNQRVYRKASLNRRSFLYKVYSYFEDMLIDLDMVKDDVSVVGLLTFMLCVSLSGAFILVTLLNALKLFFLAFISFFYLVVVIFRFMALMRYEKRESEIMDAVDLLVSDIKGGVYNAIMRYKGSFHPSIRPYFYEFLDDIQNKSYGFRQAMFLLNDKLGPNFTEFAQKAVLYEEKADLAMDDIFSSIIEVNRYRRTLRYTNGLEFATLRTQFVVSLVLILGYALFSIMIDDYLKILLVTSSIGKILIIGDIAVIAGVLAYLASVKAKTI